MRAKSLELSKVAEYAGLDADEIEKTIESGLDAGKQKLRVDWGGDKTRTMQAPKTTCR